MATLAPTARLRGRTVELRTLADALGRAAGGRPAIVVIEGEAGIGKSRLLAEALDAICQPRGNTMRITTRSGLAVVAAGMVTALVAGYRPSRG
jgi:predicted ATP-dependent serine protease